MFFLFLYVKKQTMVEHLKINVLLLPVLANSIEKSSRISIEVVSIIFVLGTSSVFSKGQ